MKARKEPRKGPALDKIIHEPARLQIISYLAAGHCPVPFTELSAKLGLTAGNLSVQLKRLKEAGYLSIAKSFRDNRPLTTVALTRSGLDALQAYLQELEEMIAHLKGAMAPGRIEEMG